MMRVQILSALPWSWCDVCKGHVPPQLTALDAQPMTTSSVALSRKPLPTSCMTGVLAYRASFFARLSSTASEGAPRYIWSLISTKGVPGIFSDMAASESVLSCARTS